MSRTEFRQWLLQLYGATPEAAAARGGYLVPVMIVVNRSGLLAAALRSLGWRWRQPWIYRLGTQVLHPLVDLIEAVNGRMLWRS